VSAERVPPWASVGDEAHTVHKRIFIINTVASFCHRKLLPPSFGSGVESLQQCNVVNLTSASNKKFAARMEPERGMYQQLFV